MSTKIKNYRFNITAGSGSIFFIVITLIVSFIVFVFIKNYFTDTKSPTGEGFESKFNFLNNSNPQLTPLPFVEMTIPYLKSRDYSSKLSALTKLAETATYTSYISSYVSDGLNINGLLTIPKGEIPTGGHPAIVFLHGYIPPTNYRTESNYASYVDYLARNGFVVFKIDLRGHDKSEGEAGGAYYSEDYIVDTLSAYSALQNSDFVNRNKIGLWGHSMAGNVILRSLVAKGDIPAAVIWAGAVYTYEDMRKYGIDDNSYRPPSVVSNRQKERERLRQTHGEFSTESTFWKQVVPTNYLEGMSKTKIEIHHAVNDSVVNIGYSRDLIDILKSNGVDGNLYEYQSGGHNLTGSSFNEAMKRTVDFFKENL